MKWVAEMWLDGKIFLFLYTKNLEAWSDSEMQKNRVSVTLTRKGMWCIHILYRLYRLNYSLWLILWISLQRYKNAWWQSWLTHLVVLSQLLFKWAARDSGAHNSAKAKVHTEWLSTVLQIRWILSEKGHHVDEWNHWCGEYNILEVEKREI